MPPEAGRLFEIPEARRPRDASHGHEVVVRCFAFCSQSPCARLSVSSRLYDPASTPTSRMTGKPSSQVRATPPLPLLVVVVLVCHLTLARACTPALVWCSHESPDYDAAYRAASSSPLQKLKSEEFESSLAQFNVTEPALIAEELCIEDLRNNKVSPLSPSCLQRGRLSSGRFRVLKRKEEAEERNKQLVHIVAIVRKAPLDAANASENAPLFLDVCSIRTAVKV